MRPSVVFIGGFERNKSFFHTEPAKSTWAISSAKTCSRTFRSRFKAGHSKRETRRSVGSASQPTQCPPCSICWKASRKLRCGRDGDPGGGPQRVSGRARPCKYRPGHRTVCGVHRGSGHFAVNTPSDWSTGTESSSAHPAAHRPCRGSTCGHAARHPTLSPD
jgi:hypothetical protein